MTSAQLTLPALRFVVPSARDIVFMFLFWSVLAGTLSNRPLADADIGWHIRTGELILANHSLPRTDPYSSTMEGRLWYAWEWLYDVLLGVLHHIGGLNAVVWWCALVVATTFSLLLYALLMRGTNILLAIALMLLAESASTLHLYARPHIVSWLFSLLWFLALEYWEQHEQPKLPSWIPWFFPVSMLLWVNLHGGWLFGGALLIVYTFAAFVERFRASDNFAEVRIGRRANRMAATCGAVALATMCNPFGWRLHAHIYSYLTDRYLMDRIDEFRSPNFHGWAERCFAVILALTLIAFAGADRSSRKSRLRLSNVLAVLLAAYAGFYSSRNLPVSSIVLVLIVGPLLSRQFAAMADRPGAWARLRASSARAARFSDRMVAQDNGLRGHLWPVVCVVVAFVACLHGGEFMGRPLIHAQFNPDKMPVAAVDFLRSESAAKGKAASPIFSTDAWGGYIIYRLFPERKVVIDDRHDLYGADRIRQYLVLTQAEPDWRGVADEWDLKTLLLPTGSTLANLLHEVPQQYSVVYQDEVATVFERKHSAEP